MVGYMIKKEQYQLEVTIANVAIESLLLVSELYLCYGQYSFVLDLEGWAHLATTLIHHYRNEAKVICNVTSSRKPWLNL